MHLAIVLVALDSSRGNYKVLRVIQPSLLLYYTNDMSLFGCEKPAFVREMYQVMKSQFYQDMS